MLLETSEAREGCKAPWTTPLPEPHSTGFNGLATLRRPSPPK